jgi:hypothetical protein
MTVGRPRATAIRVATMGEARVPAMTMACATHTSPRWPASHARSPWRVVRACTTSARAAQRCGRRAMRSWSQPTLVSTMSNQ